MKELSELEAGVVRLKKNEEQQRRIIAALEKEKEELIARSNSFSERLSRMQESYQQASQKIMDFVKNQVEPIKERLAEIGVELRSIDGIEKEISSQKKRSDKDESVINSLINQINMMQKDLESVNLLRSSLRDQSKSLEETRREMVRELERNIDSIKDDFEKKRVQDIKSQMSEFRKEIKRIAGIEEEFRAYKKTQDSAFYKISQNVADLEGTLAEIKLLRKRADSTEEFSKTLDSKLGKLSRFQGDSLAELRSELLKDLQKAADSMRKDFDQKRLDDNKAQLMEFRTEINRISNLEEEMRGYKKSHDSELSRISRLLEDAPSEIKIIKQKLSEAESMLTGFAKNSVSRSEFSDLFSNLNKRLEDSENRLFSLDKMLASERASIEKHIMELASDEKIMDRTQETVRKAISERIAEIDSRMSGNLKAIAGQAKANAEVIAKIREQISGIDTLEENSDAIAKLRERLTKMELASKQISDNQGVLETLGERTRNIDAMTREVPKRLSSVEDSIGKINEAKEILLERSQSLAEQLKSLEENLSEERQRIAAIEKEFGVTDKKKESRLDRLDREIGDVRNALAEIDVVRSRLDGIDSFSKMLDEKLAKESKSIRSEMDKRIDKEKGEQLSRISDEMKRLSGLASEMDGYSKSQEKRFDRMQKDMTSLQDSASAIPGIMSDMESMKSAIQQTLSDSKTLSSDYDSVSKQASENSGLIASLRERVVALDLAVSDVSKNQQLIARIKDRIADIGMLPEHEKEIKAINQRLAALDAPIKSISSHESEIKKLSEKMSSLKPLIDAVGKHDSDIGEFSKTLVRLESFSKTVQQSVDSMHSMRDRLTKLENLVADVSDNTKSVDELEERVIGMEAVVSQIPKTMDMVQKIKEMIANIKLLPKAIVELDDVKGRVIALEMGTKPLPEIIDEIESTRERIGGIESATKMFGKEIGEQKKILGRLSDEQRAASSSMRSEIDQRIKQMAGEQKTDASSLHDDVGKLMTRITRMESDTKTFPGLMNDIKKITERMATIDSNSKAINKEIGEQKKILGRLSDEQKTVPSSVRSEINQTIRRMAEEQKKDVVSLHDDVESLVARITDIESNSKIFRMFSKQLKSLEENLSEGRQRIAALEKVFGGKDSKKESRLDRIFQDISSIRQEIGDQRKYIGTVSESQKEILASLRSEIDKKAKQFSREQEDINLSLQNEIDEKTKKLSDDQKEMNLSLQNKIEERAKQLSSDQKETYLSLQSGINDRIKQLAQDIAEARKEQAGMNTNDTKAWLARVKDMEKKLNSYVSGNEKRLSKLSENLISIDDELKAQAIVSGSLAKSLAMAEGMMADVGVMKERVSYLSKMGEGLGKGTVKESEFINTVKSISKRIDDIESGRMDTDSKLSSDLDEGMELINKTAADIGLLKASQEDIQNSLNSRIAVLEKSLSSSISALTKKTESGLEDINGIKERISGLANLENISNMSAGEIDEIGKKLAVMDSLLKVFGSNSARIKEMAGKISSLSDMTEKMETLEDEGKAYLKEIRGLQGELSAERERISRMESDMVSLSKEHETRTRSMLDDHKRLVLAEAKKEISEMSGDIELSEERRKRDFDKILRESRDLEMRTKETIKDFGRELASMPGIEEKLSESIEKMGVESMKKMSEGQKEMVKRLSESEKTIKELSETVTELRTRLGSIKDYGKDVEEKVSELRDEIETRIKTNEDIMDSEMDAFKNKVDYLAGQLGAWKEIQTENKKEIKIVYPEVSGTPVEINAPAAIPTTRKEEISMIKRLSSKT